LHEAEAIDLNAAAGANVVVDDDVEVADKLEVPDAVPLWRAVVFAFMGLMETLGWLSYGSFRLVSEPAGFWESTFPFLIAASWLYTVVRPVGRPAATPPFDLLAVYCLQLVAATLKLGGVLFDHEVYGTPLPSTAVIVALTLNLTAVVTLLVIVVNMPLAIPSNRVRREDIASPLLVSQASLL
jgi:hypothetical protein